YWPTQRYNLRATGAIDPDSDRDGIPDSWESKNGLEPDNIDDAHLDKDSDGHSNLEEFVAGSDPTNASSQPDLDPHFRFRITPHPSIQKTGAVSPDGSIHTFDPGSHNAFDKRGALHFSNQPYSYTRSDISISKAGILYHGIDRGRLVAINTTGSERWRFEGQEGEFTSGPLFGVDGHIYAATQSGMVHALALDGTLVWQTAIGIIGDANPVMAGDGTLYLGSEDNHLYALDRQGNIKWQFATQGKIQATASLDYAGIVYVGSLDGNFYAINADGTLRWQYEVGHAINSGAVIDVDGTLYFGAIDGYLYALDSEGNLKWRYQTQSDGLTTPAIDANGVIYFATASGMFHAIDRDGKLLWQLVVGSSLSDDPVLNDDGMLYIANGDRALLGFDTLSAGPADSAWPMSGQNPGKTRTLVTPGSDADADGIIDGFDNCPFDSNADQDNFDGDDYNPNNDGNDGGGDACDSDDDNDGVIDVIDPFPKNPAEWVDTDGDGTGNNADIDDDNDQLPDTWELAHGLDTLSAQDANADADGDGFTNFEEFLNGTSPLDAQSKPVNGMLRWQLALPYSPAFAMAAGLDGTSYLIDTENQ
ncbi:MAG: PQQ-binding-like beta-propeller repeat protein, partial [Psychrosphaera sp.]|nr:PQQ-binding-like beta-propeller repeat protein [Psychrosphaera sp.]